MSQSLANNPARAQFLGLFILLLLGFLFVVNPANAQIASVESAKLFDPSNIPSLDRKISSNRIVILDFSGSMRSQAAKGNQKLYELARTAAYRLVKGAKEIDPNAKTGLIIFGNNLPHGINDPSLRAPSCEDINIEVDYGQFSNTSSNRLERLLGKQGTGENGSLKTPKGETPIIASIEKAVELMTANREDKGGAIILITDFDDRVCTGNVIELCKSYSAISDALTKNHLFLTHVVALKKSKNQQLPQITSFTQCTKSVKKIIDGPNPQPDPVQQIEDDLRSALQPAIVEATINFDDKAIFKPDLAINDLPAHYLTNSAQDEESELAIVSNITRIDMAKGKAQIFARIGGVKFGNGKIFVAERSTITPIQIRIPQSPVAFSLFDREGNRITDDTRVRWTLYLGNQIKVIENGTAGQKLNLLALPHKVKVEVNGLVAQLDVPAKPADRKDIYSLKVSTADSPLVTTNLRYAPEAGIFPGTPLSRTIFLTHLENGNIINISRWKNGTAWVGKGEYSIVVVSANGKLDLGKINIGENENLSISGDIPMPLLQVTQQIPSDKTQWTVTNNKGESRKFRGTSLTQSLPPGRYKIEAKLGTRRAGKSIDISLGSEQKTLTLDLR